MGDKSFYARQIMPASFNKLQVTICWVTRPSIAAHWQNFEDLSTGKWNLKSARSGRYNLTLLNVPSNHAVPF